MNAISIVILSILSWTFTARPTSDTEIIQLVQVSLQQGNASQLSTRFDRTIELIIDAEKVDFTAVQASHAEQILRSFFRKYPPHRFQFVHRVGSNRLRYNTGTYETDGQTFAVYVVLRRTTDQHYLINALHFRKA